MVTNFAAITFQIVKKMKQAKVLEFTVFPAIIDKHGCTFVLI
jgi:hypothetical protein